jgi:hypothetical protein
MGVSADRLILIPTGDTLTTGGIRAEYQQKLDASDGNMSRVNIGISRFEIEGARFQDFGSENATAVSAQISVLPETSVTPAIALGVRDLSDETDGLGMPYDGRSLYLAASKSIPVTGGIPLIFKNVKVHGGIGTGSLHGVFFGVEGKLPLGVRLAGEFDSEKLNAMLSYNVVPTLRVDLGVIRSDTYVGAQFGTKF